MVRVILVVVARVVEMVEFLLLQLALLVMELVKFQKLNMLLVGNAAEVVRIPVRNVVEMVES